MYSKNDYRYYLEHQLMDSDDFLAHYGVKGMKWRNRRAAQTINDTAQFVADNGIIGLSRGKKLYYESVEKRKKAWKMDKIGSIAKSSTKKTKMLNRKRPQIKAASRLIAAETANAAYEGINNAIKVNKRYR